MKKQKVKCSTMFKAAGLLLSGCIVCSLLCPKIPAAAAEGAPKAQILMVVPDETDEEQQESEENIAELLVRLGYSVTFSTAAQAEVSAYHNVLLYGLKEDAVRKTAGSLLKSQRLFLAGCELPADSEMFGNVQKTKISAATAEYKLEKVSRESVTLQMYLFGISPEYTSGVLKAEGETMPLVFGWKNVRCVSFASYISSMEKNVLIRELQLWLEQEKSSVVSSASAYLVLDYVYPFADPDTLNQMVQWLVSENISFAVSVAPIYTHSDFPAMSRFCEILKYAQENGAAIILCAPVIQGDTTEEQIQSHLDSAFQNYCDQGVYPVALEVPESWIFNGTYLSTMKHFTTVLYYEDAADIQMSGLQSTKDLISSRISLIGPAIMMQSGDAENPSCCNRAFYIDSTLSLKQQKILAGQAMDTATTEGDLRQTKQCVQMGSRKLVWDTETMQINDGAVSLQYEPAEDTGKYDYKRDVFYRATADLQQQNRFLTVFVMISLVFFICAIVLARRQMHRRFFYFEEKKNETEEKGRK
ncbi:MAG: DUF2334 domain-containing protein [Butyrivibrio sp.]|nr:DUF2334 domain-containing protein [Butyrivibrio sp.]